MKASSLAFVLLAVCVQGNDLGRGFGDKYDWKTLEAGLAEVKSTGKLGVVFIHKSWCGACKSLAPKVAESEEILKAYVVCVGCGVCVCVACVWWGVVTQ